MQIVDLCMSNQFDVTTYPVAEKPSVQVSKRDFILGQLPEHVRPIVEDLLHVLLHEVYEDGWEDGYGHAAPTVKKAVS